MKKYIFYLLALLPLFATAQTSKKKNAGKEVREQGVDLHIGAGVYMAGKKTAGYYSGIEENSKSATGGNTIDYLFKNTYIKDEITRSILESHHYIPSTSTIFVKSLPENDMRYAPALYVQLGAKYRFNKNWSIGLSYSFAQLKAKGVFFISYYPREMGNEYPENLEYQLQGKEARSVIDLSFTYLFDSEGIVKPFIDFGAHFNYVRVKKFEALIEGNKYSLIDVYGGTSYIPNVSLQTYDVRYGGAGFGFTGGLGLKIMVNNSFSLDPVFFVNESRVNLEGYKKFAFNYGFAVRFVMIK